jgi:hypothetical protein
MKLYRIRNWDTLFENNRTRDMKRMAWVPVPNHHDGDGYTCLVSRKNGAAIYGAWIVILQVASKCDPRGTLLRAPSKPHDAASISRITRIPEADIQAALTACTKETEWLEVEEIGTIPQECAEKPQDGAEIPHPPDEEQNRTEQKELNGREGNGTRAVASLVFPQELTGSDFQESWSKWESVRRAMGKKPKDWLVMFQEQIDWLAGFGSATAIGILSNSIRNNYQGLFEPKGKPMSKPEPKQIQEHITVKLL